MQSYCKTKIIIVQNHVKNKSPRACQDIYVVYEHLNIEGTKYLVDWKLLICVSIQEAQPIRTYTGLTFDFESCSLQTKYNIICI